MYAIATGIVLSDQIIDLAVAVGDLAQQRRGMLVCPYCLSLALARRLVQVASLLEGNRIDKRKLDFLTAAATTAVDDVVAAECPG